MSFTTVPAPRVLLIVSTFTSSVQFYFRQIVDLLAENPYPRVDARTAISEQIDSTDGAKYYQYFDREFPLVLQFEILKYPEGLQAHFKKTGIVWIGSAIPLRLLTDVPLLPQ